MKRLAILILSVSLLSACAAINSGGKDMIDAVIIYNGTNDMMRNVKLKDMESGGMVACSSIPPSMECSLGFQEIKNEHHKAMLSWSQDGRNYSALLNDTYATDADQTHKAMITILPHGKLKTALH